jgi:hypothetical protein
MCLHAVKMPSVLPHILLCCAWIVRSGFLLRYILQHIFEHLAMKMLFLTIYDTCVTSTHRRLPNIMAETCSSKLVPKVGSKKKLDLC